jgi:hypothetical protein
MGGFATYAIQSWAEFYDIVREMNPSGPSKVRPWIYRGQTRDDGLTTTIERTLDGWGISLEDAPFIEFQTIREFRRRLRQLEYERVHSDTLYCLALMRHHGAQIATELAGIGWQFEGSSGRAKRKNQIDQASILRFSCASLCDLRARRTAADWRLRRSAAWAASVLPAGPAAARADKPRNRRRGAAWRTGNPAPPRTAPA